jgi:hypothetical protein
VVSRALVPGRPLGMRRNSGNAVHRPMQQAAD